MATLTRSPASIAREAAAALHAERGRMIVYRRAFRLALSAVPLGEVTVLAAIDAFVAGLDPYDPLRMAWADVVQFERQHPDIEALRQHPALAWTPEQMDAVFRAAIAIEGGVS